jgi:hypothetical protein
MYASKRGGKNRVTGVNMPADRPVAIDGAAAAERGAARRSV